MEFIKKKDGTYLLVKLDKVDADYLKDLKKYGSRQYLEDTDKFFSDLFSLHVQAVYVRNYCEVLEQKGVVYRKFTNKVVGEFDRLIRQYARAIRKYMDKIYALGCEAQRIKR